MFKILRTRLLAIYYMLFYRNFIVIAGIKEFISQEGKASRRLKVIQRTDYIGDSDEVSCMAASELCKAARFKVINDSETIVMTEMSYGPFIIDTIENKLNPNNETDVFTWNQIRRAISESKFDVL